MIFSTAGFPRRSWQVKKLALVIGRRHDPNFFYLGRNWLSQKFYARHPEISLLEKKKKSTKKKKTNIGYLTEKSPLQKLKSICIRLVAD
jgi:hypothetical protein